MIHVFEDAEALAQAALEALTQGLTLGVAARGRFRLALSGGRTPQPLYRLLAARDRDALDWSRGEVLFADERAVAPDHPESNYRMVRELLLDPLGVPAGNVHRMRGEALDLERAALEYESLLAEPLDLLVLGVGEDGHVASLFPGAAALAELRRRVVVVTGPKPPPRRLTVTPRVLSEAHHVLVIGSGVGKAWAVAEALEGERGSVPARLVREREWYLDRSAARALGGAGRRG